MSEADVLDRVLVDRVSTRLVRAGEPPTSARVVAALRAEGVVLGDRGVLDVVAAVTRELTGAGPLDSLLADPATSDVLVNGPDEVWVDRGDGLSRAPVAFSDEAAVRRLAQRLAASAGRRLDTASPTGRRAAAGRRTAARCAPADLAARDRDQPARRGPAHLLPRRARGPRLAGLPR